MTEVVQTQPVFDEVNVTGAESVSVLVSSPMSIQVSLAPPAIIDGVLQTTATVESRPVWQNRDW